MEASQNLTELITDEDIKWYEERIDMQSSPEYIKICEMELHLAKSIKGMQENQNEF